MSVPYEMDPTMLQHHTEPILESWDHDDITQMKEIMAAHGWWFICEAAERLHFVRHEHFAHLDKDIPDNIDLSDVEDSDEPDEETGEEDVDDEDGDEEVIPPPEYEDGDDEGHGFDEDDEEENEEFDDDFWE